MNRIDFNNIQEKDYLYNSCSLFYDEYFTSNDKENLKSFEREIWMIGSELIDNKKNKNKKENSYRYFVRRVVENCKRV